MRAYTDEWRRTIRATIGGSSAGAALGVGRFKTRAALCREIRAARAGLAPPKQESDDLRRGRLLEPSAMELLSEALDERIAVNDPVNFRYNGFYPWAHALPDGFLSDDGIVEIKCPRPATVTKVRIAGLFPEWIAQANHNMAVTDSAFAVFGLLDPVACSVDVYRVDRDDEAIKEQMASELEFWDQYVMSGIDPPDDLPTAKAESAPDEAGGYAELEFPAAIVAARNYLEAREMADEAEELLEEAKQKLAIVSGCDVIDGAFIGGPHAFEVPGIVRVYHKPAKGARRFNQAKALERFPELSKDEFYTFAKASRPFKAYPLGRRTFDE